jgi:peptidyl-prolyl cis-trans isomerase C
MVPEFDKAVFNGDVGVLYGPIKTQFGFHLLEVTARG